MRPVAECKWEGYNHGLEMKVEIREARTAEEEREQTLAGAHAFSSQYQHILRLFSKSKHYPGSKPGFNRIVLVDGKIVSGLTIVDKVLRIGKARLRTAGVGDVFTLPGYRRRGYATRLMEDSLEFMKREGFHLTCLFGRKDFYHRVGYASALCFASLTIPVEDALHCRGSSVLKAPSDSLREELLRLRDKENERTVLGFERPEDWWNFIVKSKGGLKGCRLFLEGRRVFAYAFLSGEDELNVEEFACEPDYYGAFLGTLALYAKRRKQKRIRFTAPADHPFREFAIEYGGCLAVEYTRNGGGMLRIVNLEATAQAMEKEWERRLKASRRKHWEGEVNFQTDIGSFGLRIKNEKLEVMDKLDTRSTVRLPQKRLAQLLVGYRSVESIRSMEGVSVPGSLVSLLDAIFPKGFPTVCRRDCF